jgi:hypothetical protein
MSRKPRLTIHEILKAIDELTGPTKVQALRDNWSPALATVLKYALDPSIEWALPPGAPPIERHEDMLETDVLRVDARRLYLFVKGGHPTLKPKRREQLFVNMIKIMTPEEAGLVVAIKDKKWPFKTITAKFVNEAVPGTV